MTEKILIDKKDWEEVRLILIAIRNRINSHGFRSAGDHEISEAQFYKSDVVDIEAVLSITPEAVKY